MQTNSYTKDEKCLLALYDLAILAEDPEEVGIDPITIVQKTSISPKAVQAIVAQLIRGNFAKKIDNSLICITRIGMQVAKNLRIK